MTSKKLYHILVGVLVLLVIGLFGSAYAANKLLASKSEELVGLKATKAAKERQEAQLSKAKQDIAKYAELNEIAKSVVPQDKDQVKTVSEITSLANQSGIPRLTSVSFPPSTLGAVATKGSKVAPITPKGLTQVMPAKGMAGVYSMQITITQAPNEAVSYNSFLTFLSKLEKNRRTAQVSSINVQPDPKRPEMVSFTLVIDKYIKP